MPGNHLSEVALLERAQQRAGVPAADEPGALVNLRLLLASCRRSAALNQVGEEVLEKVVVRHLVNAVRLADQVNRHPDLLATSPAVALVITGLPRTGTSVLHKLAALDPSTRVLQLWEALSPVPPDSAGAGSRSSRVRSAEAWLERYLELVPEMRAIHVLSAEGPEECDVLLQNEFASQHLDDMFDARDYSRWLYRADLTREYANLAVQLRVLEGDDQRRSPPWLLKSPSHLAHLGTLATTFPEAVIVHCHRDPAEALSSWASLVCAVRRPYTSRLSLPAVGEQVLQRAAVATGRALAAREALGEERFVDVDYRCLVRDPVAVLAAVYERVGRHLDGEVAATMRSWMAHNPQHKHGRHRYDPADFGLELTRVNDALAAYRDRFRTALP